MKVLQNNLDTHTPQTFYTQHTFWEKENQADSQNYRIKSAERTGFGPANPCGLEG